MSVYFGRLDRDKSHPGRVSEGSSKLWRCRFSRDPIESLRREMGCTYYREL